MEAIRYNVGVVSDSYSTLTVEQAKEIQALTVELGTRAWLRLKNWNRPNDVLFRTY